MQSPHFVRFFLCISSCLSVARAFSMTVGTPTQCGDLTVSWVGGQAPFEILLTPSLEMYQNIPVPASAFSNGKGSYSIPQLSLQAGTEFLLTLSDATGFGSGGTTTQLTVGNAVANNNCNTTVASPPYIFDLTPLQPTQCGKFTIDVGSGAILPITIAQLIPGGQPVVWSSLNSYTYNSVANVNTGTFLMFFVFDSTGRQGGVSGFQQVLGSSDSSCLNANSPSSTAGMSATATITASPTSGSSSSSSSSSNSSSSNNIALIAGTAGGGAVVLIALVILICLWRKRRTSRPLDVQSSIKKHPSRLQRTDPKYETSSHSDVPPEFPFPYKTNPVSYHTRPTQPSLRIQSDTTNSSAGNFAVGAPLSSFNQTQYSRQSSNTDFPAYGDRSSTMSSAYNRIAAMSRPTSPNYPLPYPVGYPPPIRPGSQSPPLMASTRNFTVNDPPTPFNQTLHSRQSSNADFAVYGDGQNPVMSSVDRRMATVTEASSPASWETNPTGYLGPPIQSGSQPGPVNAAANLAARDLASFNQTQPSHKTSDTDFAVYGDARISDVTPVEHIAVGPRPASPLPRKTDLVYLAPPVQPGSQSISTQASTSNAAVRNPPTPFNQTQDSRQSPETNSLAVHGVSGSQSVASASTQTAAMAAGQTAHQPPPARVIVHTDADDVVPDENGVVELPPQYSEHRGISAM